MYNIEGAKKENISILIKYSIYNILEYTKNVDEKEKNRISNYVDDKVSQLINKYKLITINQNIIGAFLIVDYKGGFMIEDIYIEEDYRNKGIGSSIINDLIKRKKIVYLWVYKLNTSAIKLYENLGFRIIEETESRYLMICK